MRKWLHWIFCTIASEHCFPVQRTRSSLNLQRRKPHIKSLAFELQSYRIQEALLHKYLLFPAALVVLSVGIREVLQMYLGTALAISRVVIPITFIELWRSAMTLVFLSCVGGKKKKKSASSDLCLDLSETELSWFCPCKNVFECVCPLRFYI